jgi:hypothetical protein
MEKRLVTAAGRHRKSSCMLPFPGAVCSAPLLQKIIHLVTSCTSFLQLLSGGRQRPSFAQSAARQGIVMPLMYCVPTIICLCVIRCYLTLDDLRNISVRRVDWADRLWLDLPEFYSRRVQIYILFGALFLVSKVRRILDRKLETEMRAGYRNLTR